MTRILGGLVLAAVLAVSPLAAQRAPAAAATPDSAQLALADTLIRELRATEAAVAMAKATIDRQVEQDPSMAAFADILKAWSERVLGGSEARDRFVSLYAVTFSARELRELIDFYRTPTGQHLAASTGELGQRGLVIGQELAAAHQAELAQEIQDRAAAMSGSADQ